MLYIYKYDGSNNSFFKLSQPVIFINKNNIDKELIDSNKIFINSDTNLLY